MDDWYLELMNRRAANQQNPQHELIRGRRSDSTCSLNRNMSPAAGIHVTRCRLEGLFKSIANVNCTFFYINELLPVYVYIV